MSIGHSQCGVLKREYEKALLALERMPPYQKMLELYKAMLFYGEYRELRPPQAREALFMLDNVNFSTEVVPDPFPLDELLDIVVVEPGYATITGDSEIGDLLRELEYARAQRYADSVGLASDRLQDVLAKTVAVVTSGATGAVNAVLTAALHRDRDMGGCRTEIVFNTPCYCLPDAFARTHSLVPRPVEGTSDQHFLPPLAEVLGAIGPQTLVCFLTFPANPSLASWSRKDVAGFCSLIARCQQLGVVLVADTVFQDVVWGKELAPEIFAFAETPALLAKVHSPSKDRPRACGYRVGYVLADSALEPWLHQAEAIAKNSSNTIALVWLAFDSLFRLAMLRGGLRRSDFALIEKRYLFGYGAPELNADQLYERVVTSGLYDRYAERVSAFRKTIRSDLMKVHGWLENARCFEPQPLPDFGNLLMVRIRPPFDTGGDIAFFLDSLIATNITSTVGTAFGISPGQGLWIRVAIGSASVSAIISALVRLQNYLIERAVGYNRDPGGPI